MAIRNPIGIYHDRGEILYYGRRRNGKDIPNTRWVTITAPSQRRLLDSQDLRELRYHSGAVKPRTRTDLEAREEAVKQANDLAWLNGERQQALIEVLIDELNSLGANPPLDTNAIETAFLTKLASVRGTAARRRS